MSFKTQVTEDYIRIKELPEVDWDETGDPELLSLEEYNLLDKIIACEFSVYLLRQVAGGIGATVDTMYGIRREFIKEYNSKFERKYDETINHGYL